MKARTAIILILLLAAFLQLYQLPHLPPGLNFDEAGNGVAAYDILRGTPKLWWRIGGGKEPLWPYIIAASTAILGNIPLALRWPAALMGILTVAAVYPLGITLFKDRPDRHLIACLTTLGLAGSSWHLHFSRLGFRAVLLPLLSTLAFYFLWRSFRETQGVDKQFWKSTSLDLILSAFFIALAIYAYLAARLLPLVPLLFFVCLWLAYHLNRQRSKGSQTTKTTPTAASNLSSESTGPTSSSPHPFAHSLIRLFAYLLLFLAPLLIYFLFNPADLTARAATVSIFDPTWNNGDLIGTAWHTFTVTFGTFIGLTGDQNPLVNLPAQPAVPPLLAPFFAIGLIISLYHSIASLLPSRSPAPPPPCSPAPLLLCWWFLMLLPALLAPEGAPHHLRLIGTLVPTHIFIALGLVITAPFLHQRLRPASRSPLLASRASRLIYLLPIACYLFLTVQTYTNYFNRWPDTVDFTLPFDLYAVRLARDIAQAPAGTAYILPMDIRAGAEARHYTLDYLLADRQPAAYTYLPVDEHNAETLLTQAAAGKNELRIVRWTQDKHHEADAKEIVTYLLETQAHFLKRETFPVYDVETYTLAGTDNAACDLASQTTDSSDCNLDSPTVFKLPPIDHPIGADFDGLLRLDAAYVPPSAPAGGRLPLAMTLAPLAPMDVDYKASIRLINATGERVAQKDRILLHNFHQGTSLWPPETVNEYYLLPIPPETPPGTYTVVVVLYHPDTQAALVANGMVEVPLGEVRLEKAQ